MNKDKKIVEWNVGNKIITIHNEHVLYAFKHGKNMLMIKEKYEVSGNGFSTYDADGKIIFSYKYLGDRIIFRHEMIVRPNERIISAEYEEERRMLIILTEIRAARTILIYDENCDFIADIPSPKDYSFVALKNNASNIMVVAHGTNDMTKDSFGRNDWNFVINLDNFYVEKKSITQ